MSSAPSCDSVTLFWETVPFICRAVDRDELSKRLNVRILLDQIISHEKVLKVCIFSEDDLVFLHTLEVTEDDYSRLKLAQDILVDFGNFPQKLILLLQRCMTENSTFVAELRTLSGGQSEVHIFEINDFNKLLHLKLAFRPGTDQSIKSFLAFRLGEVTSQSQDFQLHLNQTKNELENLKENCKAKDERIRELSEKCEMLILDAKSEEKRIHLQLAETASLEKDQIRNQFEEEKLKIEMKLHEQIETLMKRNEELEISNKRLVDEKYTLDSKCSELMHQLASSEGAAGALKKSVTELREVNRTLETEKQQFQIEKSQVFADNKAMRQKIEDIEDVIELQKGRIRDLNDSRENYERRCEELRTEVATHEKSSVSLKNQIEEQKSIVQRLSLELRKSKDQCFRQKTLLARLDEIATSQKKKLKEVANSKSQIERDLKSLQVENIDHVKAIQDLKEKLINSSNQLQANDQMIRWLNDQINNSRTKKTSNTRPFVDTSLNTLSSMGEKGGPTLLASPIDREGTSISLAHFLDKAKY
eukprot:g7668.t1